MSPQSDPPATTSHSAVEDYFDGVAGAYDGHITRDPWACPTAAAELLAPVLQPGLEVLDLGVGTGESEPLAPPADLTAEQEDGLIAALESARDGRTLSPIDARHRLDVRAGRRR